MDARPLGDHDEGGRRPGPLPLLVTVVVLLAGGVLFVRVEAPSGIPAPTTTTSVPELFGLRERFDPWPTFELVWRVEGAPSGWTPIFEGRSLLDSRAPCRTSRGSVCYVRLAWRDVGSWSLAVSPDPAFGPDEVVEVVRGRVAYRLERRVVVEVSPGRRGAPPDPCRELLADSRSPSGPTIRRVVPASGAFQGPALFFRGEENLALCGEPWGIPLEFAVGEHRFQAVAVSVGNVSTETAGTSLVEGRLDALPARGCVEGDLAFSASPAGRWLGDRLATGWPSWVPVGSGMASRIVPGRDALVWVSGEEVSLEPGWRIREVDGVFLDEVLTPVAAVSARAEVGIRVWAMSLTQVGPIPEVTEEVVSGLETLVLHLVEAARVAPYRGPLPEGQPVLGPAGSSDLEPDRITLPPGMAVDDRGPGFVLRNPETRMLVAPLQRLPREGVWRVAPALPDGSPVLVSAQGGGTALVMAGGALIEVDLEDGRLPDVALEVAGSVNRCPWMGMPAQPRG